MNFKHIEAFVRVVDLGSFSKAAEAIFLSQSSVSTYINILETDLGEILINRSTKEAVPTRAGKIFYENAKEILNLRDSAIKRIKTLSGNLNGEINILASSVPSQYILPRILTQFREFYPNILFNVRQADTFEVASNIATGAAEIGFTGGIAESEKCEFKELMDEKMLVIAPMNQDFSSSKTYVLEEILYNHTFISREKGSGTRAQYENFFTNQGLDLGRINAGNSFDNTQSIITSVINGLGISIVSEFAANSFIKQKLVIPIKLETELPKRKFYYILKKNSSHSHLVRLFVDFLETNFDNFGM